MDTHKLPLKMRKRIARKAKYHSLYKEKRNYFAIFPEYKGWFWNRKTIGWIVNVLTVEGWSCAATMGSVGYLVDREISDVLPTKFSAYRWIAENVQNHDDLDHYLYSWNLYR